MSGTGLLTRAQDGARRLAGVADRLSSRTESRRGRQWALVLSAAVFVAAMAVGVQGLPEGEHHLRWWAILATSVVGVPVLVAFNALEYQVSGRVLGHRIRARDALPVAVYARAANLLPLPGAALVRMQALKREGSSYGKAASATTATALYWLAAALLVAGVAVAPDRPLIGAGFLLAGGVVTVAGHAAVKAIVARRTDGPPPGEALSLTARLLVVEVAMVVVRGVRFWLVMVGFDIGGSFQGAMVLPVAGVLASAIGFFPSGLGVREVISGGLSRMVGDSASSGLLASGLDRLVSLPVLAVISLAAALAHRRSAGPPAEVPTDGEVAHEQPQPAEPDPG